MDEFKKGDYVICNTKSMYGITHDRALCRVLEVDRLAYAIYVEVADTYPFTSDIGSRHWVDAMYFSKITPEAFTFIKHIRQ